MAHPAPKHSAQNHAHVQPDAKALADSAHAIFPAAAALLLVCMIWVAWRRYRMRRSANSLTYRQAVALPALDRHTGDVEQVRPADVEALTAQLDRSLSDSSIDPNLLAACLGDRSQAERLIRYEQKRRPKLSNSSAANAALARMRRDNH